MGIVSNRTIAGIHIILPGRINCCHKGKFSESIYDGGNTPWHAAIHSTLYHSFWISSQPANASPWGDCPEAYTSRCWNRRSKSVFSVGINSLDHPVLELGKDECAENGKLAGGNQAMKAYMATFKFGIKQIQRDYMLILMLVAPFLCGLAFKFLIPILDEYIANKFEINKLIFPYYQIFDIMLVYVTPLLVCIISSFLILEERDDEVAPYIFVTPIGYSGYILARLIIPTIFAGGLSFLVLMLFKLTKIPILLGLTLAMVSSLYALSTTLIVVANSNNKVEGLALTKITGFTFLGILAPYFIEGNIQYIFAGFPSFWLGKITLVYPSKEFITATILGMICSAIWIAMFYRVFKKRSR